MSGYDVLTKTSFDGNFCRDNENETCIFLESGLDWCRLFGEVEMDYDTLKILRTDDCKKCEKSGYMTCPTADTQNEEETI